MYNNSSIFIQKYFNDFSFNPNSKIQTFLCYNNSNSEFYRAYGTNNQSLNFIFN